MLHLCAKDFGHCRRGRGRGAFEFHTDHFRVLTAHDVSGLRVSWFKDKEAKDDVKLELEKLEGKEDVAPKRGSKMRPLAESTSDRDDGPIPAEAEHPAGSGTVAEDLTRVRAEVDKEKGKDDGKKDPKRRRERLQLEETEKDKEKEKEKDRGKEKKPRREEKKTRGKGNWFGEKAEPQHSASDSLETRSDDTPRKAKKKRKKRRRHKQADRGLFGVRRKVKFDGESSEGSKDSKSDGSEVFQAAPSEKSRQLQLIEYSQQYPGRLAARLLTKMQELLA